MSQQLSNRVVFYLFSILAVVFGALIYNISLGETIALKENFESLQDQVANEPGYSKSLALISEQIREVESIISSSRSVDETTQQKILNYIEKSKHGANLVEVPEGVSYGHGIYAIETHEIVLRGTYVQLVKLINDFETDFGFAKLKSVEFFRNENLRLKTTSLYARLYFQNITK